jgi:hypothetical protein
MKLRFPLLKNGDQNFLPHRGGRCLICDKDLKSGTGIAYLSAGAVLESRIDEMKEDFCNIEAFFSVYFHTIASDGAGGGEVNVVDSLRGGQFDLGFCSTSCLRKFFNIIVDELDICLKSSSSTSDWNSKS